MKKPILKLNVRPNDYAGLRGLAQQVKALLTANVGLFPTPNPTLVQLTTHITTLESAMATWNLRSNRGSHTDLVALRVAANDVRNDLLLLAAYVVNTADNTLDAVQQLADLLASGFAVKNVRSKIDSFTRVQSLRRVIKKNVVEPNFLIRWKKPQQLIKGSAVKMYNVYKNGVLMSTITKTSLLVVRPTGATPDVYAVAAVGDLGEGAQTSFTVTPIKSA